MVILFALRKICAACLFVLMAMLPAIDTVYCPDGCSDAGRAWSTWQRDVATAAGGCGLCLNGVAVSSPAQYSPPTRRVQPVPTAHLGSFVLTVPRPIDQPPRRS